MANIATTRSFRLVCGPERIPLVEALLRAQGFSFEPEPFYPLARRLTEGSLPLGSSLAAVFGYIYIQDRSSMLPPLALAPEQGAAVLDMCASPGSKTGLLACLVGQDGFVLANEPAQKRLATLRRNLKLQNLFWASTCSWPGERLPLPGAAGAETGWTHIQLDPPCSGWGTVEKNPQVLRLWQGDKLNTLTGLQRKLLREASRLLAPGGRLAYSTCTTNVGENEEQVRYACEELGFELLPLGDLAGFSFASPVLPSCDGVWRVETGADGQGFFVALLRKTNSGAGEAGDAPCASSGAEAAWQYCPPDMLESEWLDTALLPPGKLGLFNNSVFFLPREAERRLPRSFSWKGFPLGRVDRSGRLRSDPWLRSLMPSALEAGQRGLPCLDVDEPGVVLALLSGQSLRVQATVGEMGLYFRGLPLCRLTVKNGRAMLPPA